MEYAYPFAVPRLAGFTAAAIAAAMLFALMVLAQRVLFALDAYHDAQAQGNPDAAVWAIIVGLFGLIPGIVYLCVRSSGRSLTRCAHCGYPHDVSDYCCPKCGEKNPDASAAGPFAADFAHPGEKGTDRRAVILAAVMVISILFMLFFAVAVIRFGRIY